MYNPDEPARLRYYRFDLVNERVTPLAFKIPARRGCGPVDRNNLRGENDTLTYRRIIAARHDRCGVFRAGFDWALGSRQRPTITTLR